MNYLLLALLLGPAIVVFFVMHWALRVRSPSGEILMMVTSVVVALGLALTIFLYGYLLYPQVSHGWRVAIVVLSLFAWTIDLLGFLAHRFNFVPAPGV